MNGKPNPSRRLYAILVLALLAPVLLVMPAWHSPAAAEEAKMLTIVAFGDSLTAGYMLPRHASFPAQLQVALAEKGYKVAIGNAGVSGDTTTGGLERFEWTLKPGADAVILELGANDAMRGTDPKIARDNLDKMLAILKARNIPVLLTGMKAPANWGAEYQKAFDSLYGDLAAKYGVPLYPFFLEGVALDPALVQPDGLHPTERGVAEIVKRILPQAEQLLKTAQERKAALAR